MFPFPAWLRRSLLILPLAGLIFLGLQAPVSTSVQAAPAPEFTGSDTDWLNGGPLDWQQLRGKVVLLDVWTFECWNCYRSFPWLRTLERGFAARGLRVIGIHSPEFEREREPARVRAKVREFELDHPVMIDNDLAYWRALGNRYWPAFYLVDKQGRVRQVFVGETHAGDAQATRIEAQVEKLLAE